MKGGGFVLLTEDEARKKWCPFDRVAIDRNSAQYWGRHRLHTTRESLIERDEEIERVANSITDLKVIAEASNFGLCIASGCMAWRSPDGANGFCGLAGGVIKKQ